MLPNEQSLAATLEVSTANADQKAQSAVGSGDWLGLFLTFFANKLAILFICDPMPALDN